MKKILILTVAFTLIASGVAFAGIRNSKHDLSNTSSASVKSATQGQICIYCHFPHNTGVTPLLWNLKVGEMNTTGIGNYGSSTMNQATGAPTSGSTGTWECMGCHDGVITTSALTKGTTDQINFGTAAGNLLSGTDLGDDHPVNMTYTAVADVINAVNSIQSAGLVLYSGKVQCMSCHDVHDYTNTPFLRKSNTGSKLCLTCHLK